MITGKPKSGKTTLVRGISSHLSNSVGFYTVEIREKGVRVGFKIVDFEGREELLASKNLPSFLRVGKYGVNLPGLEKMVERIKNRLEESKEVDWVVIDEVGKMEMMSEKFYKFLLSLKDSSYNLLFTVGLPYRDWINRHFANIEWWEIHPGNREEVRKEILQRLGVTNGTK